MSNKAEWKRGDRGHHPSVGNFTVASGKLGPNGELKVKPDIEHHSKKKVIEVMSRRCEKIDG